MSRANLLTLRHNVTSLARDIMSRAKPLVTSWQWHQLCHIQVCTSLQTDNHVSTQPLNFLQAGCPSCRPTNSVRALKATNSRVSRPKLLPLHYWQVACLPIILCHYVNYELPRRETARTPGRFSVYRLQPHSGLVVPTTDILRSTSRHVASLRAGLTLMIY